jgi:RHS repeat-associated protein
LLFTGHPHDAATGLTYARNRYYRADWGRWISADPLHYIDGMNRYAYVRGNVVNLVDPLGLHAYLQGYFGAGTYWKGQADSLRSQENYGVGGFFREFRANAYQMVGTVLTPEDLHNMYDDSVDRIALAASATAGDGVMSQLLSVAAATGGEFFGVTMMVEAGFGIDLHGREMEMHERVLGGVMGSLGVASSVVGGSATTRVMAQSARQSLARQGIHSLSDVGRVSSQMSRRVGEAVGDFSTGFRKGFDSGIRVSLNRSNAGVDPTPLLRGTSEGIRHVLYQGPQRRAMAAQIRANVEASRAARDGSGFANWSRSVDARSVGFERISAAERSASFQGTPPYFNIDYLKNIRLKRGTVLGHVTFRKDGIPVSEYFTTVSAIRRATRKGHIDGNRLNQGLQIYPGIDPQTGVIRPAFKPYVQLFELVDDLPLGGAAMGRTLANPHLNPGNFGPLPQVFVKREFHNALRPIELRSLSNNSTPNYKF